MNGDAPGKGWGLYWLIWFAVACATFLGPEIYALATNWRNTLSNAIWHAEKLVPGQGIGQWTFAHLMFIGVLGLVFVWLLGHFALGWWR